MTVRPKLKISPFAKSIPTWLGKSFIPSDLAIEIKAAPLPPQTGPSQLFTGIVHDSMGRRQRYVQGEHVPLGEGEEAPPTAASTQPEYQTAPPQGEISTNITGVGKAKVTEIPDSETTTESLDYESSIQEKNKERQSLGQTPTKDMKTLGGNHANETSLLLLKDGRQAVYKSSLGEVQWAGAGIKEGTMYRREVATSYVADLLGFGDLVPTTAFRKTGVEVGSAQNYVEAKNAATLKGPGRFDGEEDSARAAVLDYITGAFDRHANNWMVQETKIPPPDSNQFSSREEYAKANHQWEMAPKSKYKLSLIDNGISFPTEYPEPKRMSNHQLLNMQFWKHSSNKDMKMPDVTTLKDKWPQVEQALTSAGIEKQAILLTKKRFEAVVSNSGKSIKDLPSMILGFNTLGELANEDQY